MSKSGYIPQYLDEPERLLFWTLDEALVMFVPLVLGLMVSGSVGIALGAGAMFIYRKFKNLKAGVRTIKGYCYWTLPGNFMPAKRLPPSYLREFIG